MDELHHCILSYSALSIIWHHLDFVSNQLKPPNELYTVLIRIIGRTISTLVHGSSTYEIFGDISILRGVVNRSEFDERLADFHKR